MSFDDGFTEEWIDCTDIDISESTDEAYKPSCNRQGQAKTELLRQSQDRISRETAVVQVSCIENKFLTVKRTKFSVEDNLSPILFYYEEKLRTD